MLAYKVDKWYIPYQFMISLALVKKACSTVAAFLEDVPRKGREG
jgi:hypothetical protein